MRTLECLLVNIERAEERKYEPKKIVYKPILPKNMNNSSRFCMITSEKSKALSKSYYIDLVFRLRIHWFMIERLMIENSIYHTEDLYAEKYINQWTVPVRVEQSRQHTLMTGFSAFKSRMGIDDRNDLIVSFNKFAEKGNIPTDDIVPLSRRPYELSMFDKKASVEIFVTFINSRFDINLDKFLNNYGSRSLRSGRSKQSVASSKSRTSPRFSPRVTRSSVLSLGSPASSSIRQKGSRSELSSDKVSSSKQVHWPKALRRSAGSLTLPSQVMLDDIDQSKEKFKSELAEEVREATRAFEPKKTVKSVYMEPIDEGMPVFDTKEMNVRKKHSSTNSVEREKKRYRDTRRRRNSSTKVKKKHQVEFRTFEME